MLVHAVLLSLCVLGLCSTVLSQSIPNSFPHAWPGQPEGDFNLEVTEKLPNITGSLPRSFAGNINVNRAGHPNNTLFFWAFEKVGANGSLTAPASQNNTDPWIIWLQGGPGSSGMIALTTENGPIHVQADGSWVHNNFSWNTLADTIWIDQPVGTGFSTSDSTGYIPDEDQMGEDFIGFLSNLVKIFPSLASRPLFLTGESYAGTYIPYITKHIFQTSNPPVNLRKIAIGDGSLGSQALVEHVPVLNVIETYPALIGYDEDVFNFFREQTHLCGFDLNFTYPQEGGHFPTLDLVRPTAESALAKSVETRTRILRRAAALEKRDLVRPAAQEAARAQWKRDLSGRANGTIDPFYGCFLLDELEDYALNFTFPWSNGGFDVYDVPDGTNPEPFKNASAFFNSAAGRAALHAPTSKDWLRNFNYPFGSTHNHSAGNQYGDPSVEPVAFLSALAANASAANVSIVFYSGNDDSLVQHRGTEAVIQNTTFGGAQGFARAPATPWFDDAGAFAGVVHQERGLAYVLFQGAGHLVPMWRPAQALVFLREFVLGENRNGTLEADGRVVGGEDAALAGAVLPGGDAIFFGSSATQGTSTVPAATRSAWAAFVSTATAATTPTGATSGALQGRFADTGLVSVLIALLVSAVVPV
ncbi:alpha/beta-hydrolase [Epithele typhae]|uniref:alpha/beta-hydrolase n=1 Tax=Epithele typhae TaxID=378194 RepID=UPI00200773EA|nr:alpha/beta-hydrolase [Epithele typhae]KAH9945200.1 alpha/beta-hydrolase [Epithele typhae]